jgi:hypothetical protein
MDRSRRLPPWVSPAAVGAGALAVCVTLAVVSPESRARWSPGCPFRAVTGLDCPGCGATRALHALTRGEIAVAADHNLLLLALLPLAVWAWWRWLAVGVGWRDTGPQVPSRLGWTLAIAFPAFMVARNVPVWPLSWLGSGLSA